MAFAIIASLVAGCELRNVLLTAGRTLPINIVGGCLQDQSIADGGGCTKSKLRLRRQRSHDGQAAGPAITGPAIKQSN